MRLSQMQRWQYLVTVGAIAVAYFATARLSTLALGLAEDTFPLLPAAGVALTALLVYGRQVWAGVALGAFLFTVALDGSYLAAVSAAVGSTLSAVVAEWLLRRTGFDPALKRLRDVLGLVVLAVLLSPMIHATLSTLGESLVASANFSSLGHHWLTVWVGDGMGILVITPMLLTWRRGPVVNRATLRLLMNVWQKNIDFRWKAIEAVTWLGLLLGISCAVFESRADTALLPFFKGVAHYPLEYLPFPLVVWAALRLGQRGAVLASLIVSMIAIWGAVQETGPFIAKSNTTQQAVLLLQAFIGVITLTALVLSAAVAERQRVEDLLRRSEASLINAQRIAQIGNWDLDLTPRPITLFPFKEPCVFERQLRWSDEIYRILGYEPQAFAPSWEAFIQAVHPDDRDRVTQAVKAAVFNQVPYCLDYRIVLPDGSERIVSEQVEICSLGITGTVQDVTDRKRVETELQQSEARFRVVAETAACGIFVYQGVKCRYVNSATEVITGYSRDELLTMSFWDIVHPEFQDMVRERGLARQRGEPVPNQYEMKIITKGGEERWIEFTAGVIHFEGHLAGLGTGYDITDRKLAEAQLKSSAERDRLLKEIALRIRESLELEEILKTTVEEVRHFLHADRVFISHVDQAGRGSIVAESVDPQWNSIRDWITDPQATQEIQSIFIEHRVRVVNDTSQVELTPFLEGYYQQCQVKAGIAVPIVLDDRMFGVLVANQCSAPRQWQPLEIELLEQLSTQVAIAIQQGQLYQKLQTLNDALEGLVWERTALLQQKMQELQALNEKKDMLLHAVSHDLRTPVLGMLMVLKNLQSKPGDMVSLSRHVLQRMLESSDRQLGLINSLSEDHCLELQNISLYCEPLQLNDLIQGALHKLDNLLVTNNVKVINQIPLDLPPIYADAGQLKRVFENLIDNTLKHNPPGVTLTFSATVENNQVRCIVQDNGVGMTSEQCDRLFKLYVRGIDNRHLTGIGLGLYICRQIIHAHGGETGVASTPGSGASFWFTLPLSSTAT